MKTFKVIGECCLVFLAVIAVCISLGYGYYHFFVKDLVIGVNEIADQDGVVIKKEEDLTEEEKSIYDSRWFMEANYYSNDKNNGIELQELKFNYFRNYNLTEENYRSTGMQFLGDYEHHDVQVYSDSERDNYVFSDFYYYDTSDDISFSGYSGRNKDASVSTVLKRSTSFTVKIDNRAFEMQLDKYYKTGWWIFGSTHYFTYSELFQSVFNAIKSNSKGYGDYFITVDLSDFFTIYEYDLESGKAKADNVSDIIKNYAVLKFHYDENGAKNSSQSLFGSIECNSKYDTEEKDIDTSYWQERALYTLNESSTYLGKNLFNYRYSDTYEGYFISLTMDGKKLFADMPRTKVSIALDFNSKFFVDNKIKVVGIDYNGFENFEIDTLSISGNPQTIHVLESALYNTKLQTLKHSEGITFDFAENSTNNEFLEVII